MKVVIIGGGFGGLALARALKDAPVEVVLIDRRNFHLFQPLLYQVATGGLSPANIATPLRSILSEQKNASVLLAEATGFDPSRKRVLLKDGDLEYDILVIATGAQHHYFGHPEWAEQAPGLKTLEDALDIRRRILLAFENAERETDPERAAAWLNFVIVGGGPTGVELAGAISEIARHTLFGEYRNIRPADARIYLVEAMDRVLPPYPAKLSAKASESLRGLGVTVMTGSSVSSLNPGEVLIKRGEETETIAARTVLWAAGVQASPLSEAIRSDFAVETDRAGRILVQPDLSLAGQPDVFVIGDLAHLEQDGSPLPAVAPVAMQQGRYVAQLIKQRIAGKMPEPFRYRSQGMLATIGRASAVADFGFVKLSGFLGWLTWLFIHLFNLAQFENRLLVMVQWAWNYFTHGRSARLITGSEPTEPEKNDKPLTN